jgi:voltage-dependent calcium channel T type alpha-1G
VKTRDDCLAAGGEWQNSERNFDNIFSAIWVLQEIITTEGWLDVMYFGIDSMGIDMQPSKNHNLLNSLFFISFIITGNIFVLNLFVGIVIDKFNRLKDKICGYMMMTRFQKDWVELEKQMVRLEIEPFKNPPDNP